MTNTQNVRYHRYTWTWTVSCVPKYKVMAQFYDRHWPLPPPTTFFFLNCHFRLCHQEPCSSYQRDRPWRRATAPLPSSTPACSTTSRLWPACSCSSQRSFPQVSPNRQITPLPFHLIPVIYCLAHIQHFKNQSAWLDEDLSTFSACHLSPCKPTCSLYLVVVHHMHVMLISLMMHIVLQCRLMHLHLSFSHSTSHAAMHYIHS